MPNITYIDGKYLKYEDSKIHINDRGYHFGDAVYEVIVFNKNIFYGVRRNLLQHPYRNHS